jgi:hypothetical protein
MHEANVTFLDLELRGLVQRCESLNGDDAYSLTDKGQELACQLVASLPADHFVLINMLVKHLISESTT